MAAALGTFRFLVPGNRVKAVSAYASDASNALIRFDEGKVAGANSNDGVTLLQGGTLIDVCWTSDVATPTHVQLLVNGTPSGDVLDFTAHLASVVNRPNPTLGIPSQAKLQAMQVA